MPKDVKSMSSSETSLTEETVKAIDALQAKKASDRIRRGPAKGVGVRQIHAFLQTLQLDNRSTSLEVRIKYSEVFDILCTSLESMSIFQFEGADASDIYFSLRGPKEEMLELARKIPAPQKFDRSKYVAETGVPEMRAFNELAREVEDLARDLQVATSKIDDLQKANEELDADLRLLNNTALLKRQHTLAQETVTKLG